MLQDEPDSYSKEKREEYEDLRTNLQKWKDDESLTNAKDSPFKAHQEMAVAMIDELDKASENCSHLLRELDSFKKDAETLIGKIRGVLNDPNIANGGIDNFDKLQEIQSNSDKVAKLWPDDPDLQSRKEEVKVMRRRCHFGFNILKLYSPSFLIYFIKPL